MSNTQEPREGQAQKGQPDFAICLEHVHKSFGPQTVLDDISFEIRAGEAFGILGRSGTGKSVTLALMIGLLTAESGKVLIEQKDLNALDRGELMGLRKAIGFLFQQAALFDSLSVRENVAFPLRRHTHKKEAKIAELVNRSLEDLGLEGSGDKMPSELSGGMRKRVGLARALVLDPRIVLVDEPSSGLDVITASEIYNLLRKLKERHKTVVVVTHDGSAMGGIVDRLVVLDSGRIVAQGTAEALAQSDNDLVRALVAGRER